MKRGKIVFFLLRLSLAFAFFYAGVGAIMSPGNWIDFLPQFLSYIMPPTTFLLGFGIFEIVLAGWILSGKKLLWSAAIAAAMLGGIVVFNVWAFSVVFRDVSLMFVALALAISTYPTSRKE